jgi:hypothetical protein
MVKRELRKTLRFAEIYVLVYLAYSRKNGRKWWKPRD